MDQRPKMRMTATLLALAAPSLAAAQDVRATPWSLSGGGGVTAIDDAGDQPFVRIGLRREFGDSYARIGASFIGAESGNAARSVAPADTWQLTLGGGASFNALSIDGYVLAGIRSFDREYLARAGGRGIGVASDGATYGAGASLTLDLPLGEAWFVSPFVAVDYSRLDVAVTLTRPNGGELAADKTSQDGVTGSGGVTLQRLFGRSSLAAYAAYAATTNATSANRQGSGTVLTAPRFIATDGQADDWLEYGASGSVALGPRLNLDLSVVRTAGLDPGEATAAAATLRIAF